MGVFRILGGIEEVFGSLPEFHLELKFKAQKYLLKI